MFRGNLINNREKKKKKKKKKMGEKVEKEG
jgi:hypothetical protein